MNQVFTRRGDHRGGRGDERHLVAELRILQGGKFEVWLGDSPSKF